MLTPNIAYSQDDQRTIADYPYAGTYVNLLPDIIHPDINYINPEMVVQEAVISAVQPVSFNEIGQSYYRFSTEETQKKSWAQAMYKSYTLVDWRQFLSTNLVGDATYVFGTGDIRKGSDTGSHTTLTADAEVKRAFEILKNKAFVPENVSMDNFQVWNSLTGAEDTVPRTYAIMSMYMAMGKEYFLPPIISHNNLDGQKLPDGDITASIKDMKKTSLFSLPDASRFSYYSVLVRDAMHYIYQAPTLVEGYLWAALQDGIISVEELTEKGRTHLSNFASGKYAQPISSFNIDKLGIPSLSAQMADGKSYLLGQRIGVTDAANANGGTANRLVVRTVVNPNALKNENMTLIDFCVYLAQVMHLQGEPVLTAAEQQMLVAAYGNRLPIAMSEDYYKTILYLVARGIVGDDIPVASFYEPLTYRNMYVLLSRVADPASRLTFKYVTIPFDLSMAEEGFMPLTPSISNLSITDLEIEISNSGYYDILVKKDDNTLFLNKSGKEEKPYISRQQDYGDPAYGKVLTSAVPKDLYYHFRIYTDYPRPAVSAKQFTVGGKTYYRYYLYADNSDKKLTLQFEDDSTNMAPGGVYIYDQKTQMLVKDEALTASVFPKYEANGLQLSSQKSTMDTRVSRVFGDGIRAYLTAADDEKVLTNVEVTFKLKKNVDLSKLTIAGTTYTDWKNDMDCPVRLLSEDNTGYILNMTVETATPDDVLAIVASQIVTEKPIGDSVAYVRRASTNDIYYSIGFLEKELGCSLLEFDNETYVLSFPAEKILVKKTDAGWLVYGTNSIIRFMSNIPAVKKRVNANNQTIENSFDNYLVHGYVVEHYMRANYNKGWSTFIGTDGVLHITSLADDNRSSSDFADLTIEKEDLNIDLKIVNNSKVYNLLSPTLTDMSDSFKPLYEDVNTGEKYLDLRAVPPNLTNAITMWNISGTGQITAGVISLVPNHTFKASNDPTTLKNAISRSDIVIGQSTSFNYRYMQASQWGTVLPDYGNSQIRTNGWILTEYLRYDPATFTLLYKLPNSNDLQSILADEAGYWRLPYAYDNKLKQVVFVNLPFLKDNDGEIKFLKSDVEMAILDAGISEIAELALDAAADEENFGERQWFPVAPLSELFIQEADQPWFKSDFFGLKSFGYGLFESIFKLSGNWNKIFVVGPYQLTEMSGGNSQRLRFNLNQNIDKQGLPSWANLIYGDLKDDISKESPVYVLEFDSKSIILPALNTLSSDSRSKKSTNLADRIVSLDATIGDGLKDVLSTIFENEKKLSRKLEDAEGIISIIYLFVIVVIPRFLILSLFLVEILALVSKYRPVIWFSKKVFDPFKAASFGRTNIDEIRPWRFFICCSLGMVFIILVSREYATMLVAKALEAILIFFRF